MDSVNNQQIVEDFKVAKKWAVIGVVVNIVLTTFKAFAGVKGGSSAMVADALHSASDIFSSAVVFVSLKITEKPADEKHPYGHGKAEAIATAIVGVVLFVAGIQILMAGIDAIRSGSIDIPGTIAFYAAILSIVTKEMLYRLTFKVGKRINSPATMANAMHHRSDAFSSIATLIGIGGALLGFPIMDKLAGMIVSLFILKMGIDILRDGTNQIMDSSAGTEKIDNIEKAALNTPGVEDAHDIRIRQSGTHYLVDLHISVDRDMSIYEAHKVGEVVRSNIHKDVEKIYEVIVHIDPKDKMKVQL